MILHSSSVYVTCVIAPNHSYDAEKGNHIVILSAHLLATPICVTLCNLLKEVSTYNLPHK